MLIFCWFRYLEWLTVGSNEYRSWYKGKSTIPPGEGGGLNWINKLIWLIPSHTGTRVLVQWRARAELPLGDEQSVFISSPALNLLEPNCNHTLRLWQFMSNLSCPSGLLNSYLGNWFVPGHDASFLMVCVCPPVLFWNTLMQRSAQVSLGTGVELWICLCWSVE